MEIRNIGWGGEKIIPTPNSPPPPRNTEVNNLERELHFLFCFPTFLLSSSISLFLLFKGGVGGGAELALMKICVVDLVVVCEGEDVG